MVSSHFNTGDRSLRLFLRIMKLTLTNYGKKILMIATVIVLLAILIAGAPFVLMGWAYKLGVNQDALNTIYVIAIMPTSVCGSTELIFRIRYGNPHKF